MTASLTTWLRHSLLALLVLSSTPITTWAAPTSPAAPNVLIYGDSLSAGYGIALEQSWPALLEKRLGAMAKQWRMVNASISGETSAGGLARLPAALDQFQPKVLVLALGANDGLRGLPVAQLRENLGAMIKLAKARKASVLLVGMRLPPNYGPAYNTAFEATFTDLARIEKIALLPFLLEPVAADPDAFQPDRLHPVAAVQPKLVDHVWSALRPLLK